MSVLLHQMQLGQKFSSYIPTHHTSYSISRASRESRVSEEEVCCLRCQIFYMRTVSNQELKQKLQAVYLCASLRSWFLSPGSSVPRCLWSGYSSFS